MSLNDLPNELLEKILGYVYKYAREDEPKRYHHKKKQPVTVMNEDDGSRKLCSLRRVNKKFYEFINGLLLKNAFPLFPVNVKIKGQEQWKNHYMMYIYGGVGTVQHCRNVLIREFAQNLFPCRLGYSLEFNDLEIDALMLETIAGLPGFKEVKRIAFGHILGWNLGITEAVEKAEEEKKRFDEAFMKLFTEKNGFREVTYTAESRIFQVMALLEQLRFETESDDQLLMIKEKTPQSLHHYKKTRSTASLLYLQDRKKQICAKNTRRQVDKDADEKVQKKQEERAARLSKTEYKNLVERWKHGSKKERKARLLEETGYNNAEKETFEAVGAGEEHIDVNDVKEDK